MMKRSTFILLLIAGAALVSGTASAGRGQQVRYVGIHPIAKAQGGGLCHIEAPHVHVWTPGDAKVHYREHDGDLYFVGDPVAYGWDGPRHSYYGHHPIRVDVVVGDDHEDTEYCYLDGPHYHAYAPPPALEADFQVVAGASWYVGAPAPAYIEARPALVKVNAIYTPIEYERPVVVVETPPPGWIGLHVDVRTPDVVVEAPRPRPRPVVAAGVSAGLEVHVPAPTLSVEVGLPGIYIGGGGHHHHDVVVVDRHKHKHKHHGRGRGRGHWNVGGRGDHRARVVRSGGGKSGGRVQGSLKAGTTGSKGR
jgi:hypothetical protein